MLSLIQDPQIQQILTPPTITDPAWKKDLKRFESGDLTLTRRSAGENSIRAFQRLLIFLGYSTSASGSFSIDGDFGRGSNRGLAQFMFDHGIASDKLSRKTLAYPCSWNNAKALITTIPDVHLTISILEKMLQAAKDAIVNNQVNCGTFEEAIFQLNAVSSRTFMTCKQINKKYGTLAEKAAETLTSEGKPIRPEWILSIIRQETAGVVRPRFEQHLLTRFNKKAPDSNFVELRYRGMSFGLGQILGDNYKVVGADSAIAMFTNPLEEQVIFIGRFLTARQSVRTVVNKMNPTADDFKVLARYYNGPGFAKHHYDEGISRWFREFLMLRG